MPVDATGAITIKKIGEAPPAEVPWVLILAGSLIVVGGFVVLRR